MTETNEIIDFLYQTQDMVDWDNARLTPEQIKTKAYFLKKIQVNKMTKEEKASFFSQWKDHAFWTKWTSKKSNCGVLSIAFCSSDSHEEPIRTLLEMGLKPTLKDVISLRQVPSEDKIRSILTLCDQKYHFLDDFSGADFFNLVLHFLDRGKTSVLDYCLTHKKPIEKKTINWEKSLFYSQKIDIEKMLHFIWSHTEKPTQQQYTDLLNHFLSRPFFYFFSNTNKIKGLSLWIKNMEQDFGLEENILSKIEQIVFKETYHIQKLPESHKNILLTWLDKKWIQPSLLSKIIETRTYNGILIQNFTDILALYEKQNLLKEVEYHKMSIDKKQKKI